MFTSSNPLEDAIDYINYIDSQPYEFMYQCVNCSGGFDPGFGVDVEGDKFCLCCFKENKHQSYIMRHDKLSIEEFKTLTITIL